MSGWRTLWLLPKGARERGASRVTRGPVGATLKEAVPFVAYVHEPEKDPSPKGPPPWEPNWRVWRPLLLALPAVYGAANTEGVASVLLVLIAFGLACRALSALLPDWNGMSEYHQ